MTDWYEVAMKLNGDCEGIKLWYPGEVDARRRLHALIRSFPADASDGDRMRLLIGFLQSNDAINYETLQRNTPQTWETIAQRASE
jgi:hypothetical protein